MSKSTGVSCLFQWLFTPSTAPDDVRSSGVMQKVRPIHANDVFVEGKDLSSSQEYRLGRGQGINAVAAWSKGIHGEGVRVSDVEGGWNAHAQAPLVARNSEFGRGGDGDHGIAVIGIIAGQPGNGGIAGLAPKVTMAVYSDEGRDGHFSPAKAIQTAAAHSKPGDIIVVEEQVEGDPSPLQYLPSEYEPAIWDAIRAATDHGVIVIEAAGNGGNDLGAAYYAKYRARGDSGAIMVGAGSSDTHQRLWFSNYGQRVDVQAWGENVVTLGYGEMSGSGPKTQYTGQFGGTSSATPIVASAAALVQSYAQKVLGRPLTPSEMRHMLVESGRRLQDEGQKIGSIPDVGRAMKMVDELKREG
jgi:subtilisin family serine protease